MQQPRGNIALRRRHGYLLVAVLICLVVAGLGLVTFAQRSMRLSTLAIQQQRELQHRWGILSCQRTMLPAAPSLFATLQEQAQLRSSPPPAPATFTSAVVLGGARFELLLADENAKLNLNQVYHHHRNRLQAEQFLNRALGGRFRLPVRLHPEVKRVDPLLALRDGEKLPIALRSWGQVFDLASNAAPATPAAQLPRLMSRLTLWGQGKLNVRRAADATIVDACQLVEVPAAAGRLLKERRDRPRLAISLLVGQLNVDDEQQLLLQQLLTERSFCFSLWTTVRSTNFQTQRFAVLQVDEEGVSRTTEFAL